VTITVHSLCCNNNTGITRSMCLEKISRYVGRSWSLRS